MPSAVGAEARCNLDRFYVGGLFLTQNFLRLRRAISALLEPPAGAAAPAGQIELTLTAMIMHAPSDPPIDAPGTAIHGGSAQFVIAYSALHLVRGVRSSGAARA